MEGSVTIKIDPRFYVKARVTAAGAQGTPIHLIDYLIYNMATLERSFENLAEIVKSDDDVIIYVELTPINRADLPEGLPDDLTAPLVVLQPPVDQPHSDQSQADSRPVEPRPPHSTDSDSDS